MNNYIKIFILLFQFISFSVLGKVPSCKSVGITFKGLASGVSKGEVFTKYISLPQYIPESSPVSYYRIKISNKEIFIKMNFFISFYINNKLEKRKSITIRLENNITQNILPDDIIKFSLYNQAGNFILTEEEEHLIKTNNKLKIKYNFILIKENKNYCSYSLRHYSHS